MHFPKRKHPQDYLTDQTYLSGLLTGVLAGLTIGFLFAPRSGKELRKQIAGSVSDQTKEVQNQWDKTKAQAKETIDNIKTNVGYVADKAEDKADQLADEAKSGLDKAKDTFRIG